jgi:hypothetical protein
LLSAFELRATRFFDAKLDRFGTSATTLALQNAVLLATRRSSIRGLLEISRAIKACERLNIRAEARSASVA